MAQATGYLVRNRCAPAGPRNELSRHADDAVRSKKSSFAPAGAWLHSIFIRWLAPPANFQRAFATRFTKRPAHRISATRSGAYTPGLFRQRSESSCHSHSHTPRFCSCRVAFPAQSTFDPGHAGLGCKILPTLTSLERTASSARLVAKSPTPMIHSGRSNSTHLLKCSPHTLNRGSRSSAGNLSGVRFRPLSSMKASGQ